MNKILWNYYKQSADGQKAIEMFDPNPDDVYKNIEAIATFANGLDSDFNPQQFVELVYIHEINFVERNLIEEETFTRESFEHFIDSYDLMDFEVKDDEIVWLGNKYIISANKFRLKAAAVDALSMYL